MWFCSPDALLPADQFFYCQDNWFLIGVGAIVVIVIAALLLFAVVAHFFSLIQMVDWWDTKKEAEEKVVESLTKRVTHLEETIARDGILSPGGDAKNDEVDE